MSKAERESRVISVLREVELDPETRHRYPHEFSGGQRQRIAIARAIILKPKFIVLDEPTSALDRSVQAQIIELLRNLQRDHTLAFLFISHDLAVVRAMASYIIVLRDGKVVEQGKTAADFSESNTGLYSKTDSGRSRSGRWRLAVPRCATRALAADEFCISRTLGLQSDSAGDLT